MSFRTQYGSHYHSNPGCPAIAGKDILSCAAGSLDPCSICCGSGPGGGGGNPKSLPSGPLPDFPDSDQLKFIFGHNGEVLRVPPDAEIHLNADGSFAVYDHNGDEVDYSEGEQMVEAVINGHPMRIIVDKDGNKFPVPSKTSLMYDDDGNLYGDDVSGLEQRRQDWADYWQSVHGPDGPFWPKATEKFRKWEKEVSGSIFRAYPKDCAWHVPVQDRAHAILAHPSYARLAIERGRQLARLAQRMGFKHPRFVLPVLEGMDAIVKRHPVAKMMLNARNEMEQGPRSISRMVAVNRIMLSQGCPREVAEAQIEYRRSQVFRNAEKSRTSQMRQRGTTVEQELGLERKYIESRVRQRLCLSNTNIKSMPWDPYERRASPIKEKDMTADQREAMAREYQHVLKEYGFGDNVSKQTINGILRRQGLAPDSDPDTWDSWTRGLWFVYLDQQRQAESRRTLSRWERHRPRNPGQPVPVPVT